MQKNYLTMALAAVAVLAPATMSAAAPMPPSNVVATETSDGIVLTWTAVSEDQDEESVDPAEVVYDVFRINAATDESTAVAQDIAATTYTDPLTGITGDNVFKWQIIAKTDGGSSSSYEGYSNEVFLGNGVSLPFIETFNTPGDWGREPDNFWVAAHNGGWSDFRVDMSNFADLGDSNYVYIYGIDRTDETQDGFVYFEPSKWSAAEATYTSGKINLADGIATGLSFHYFAAPNPKDSFSAIVIDGSNVEHVLASIKPEAAEAGWQKAEYSLTEYIGQSIRIQFKVAYDPDNAPEEGIILPICIDQVTVMNNTDVSVAETAVGSVIATEYYTIEGMRIDTPRSGQLVIRRDIMDNGSVKTSKMLK